VPGSGWSSPIVVDGKVYLTSAIAGGANDLSLSALCLSVKDGKKLWQQELFVENLAESPQIHRKNSHASPTPLIEGQRLFVHFGHMGTACLDLDGKVLWKNDTIRYAPVHGNGGSPILVDGKLIFSCDGSDQQFVIALDTTKGKVLWRTDRQADDAKKKFSFSTPLFIDHKGQKQIVSPGPDAVVSYDPANGKELWRVSYAGYSVIPRPVYGHGLVFLSTSYDSPSLLAINPEGKGDITKTNIVWRTNKNAPHTPSPLLVGDELYTVSDAGFANCYDAKTGKVHWSERLDEKFSASPVYADGKIYLQSEDGVGIVLKAGQKFEELKRNKMDERTLASYAFAEGALFLRTAQHLYRIQDK
jgi:outer membrane protein assembly factor BamB